MDFLNINFLNGMATILAAFIAIFLYYWERSKKKRDAAKIIVQEIRRAEDIINEYKEHSEYKFTKKIIATNSWAKNIHYFVMDLDQDELDKISNLYSTGEYLDSIIIKVSDYKFDENIKIYQKKFNQMVAGLNQAVQNQQSTSVIIQPESQPTPKIKDIKIPIQMPEPWKTLLDEISKNYEPVYHSNICEKLKKIAKI